MHESQQMMALTRRVEAAVGDTARAVEQSNQAAASLRGEADTLRRALRKFVPPH
jgi:methyl-accepting chemotaxis protein